MAATWKLRYRAAAFVVALSALANAAGAQGVSWRHTGYLKNLAISSASLLDDERFLLNTSRARTSVLADFGTRLHTEVWLDSELLLGDYLRTTEFGLSRLLQPQPLLDLSWILGDNDDYVLQQRLFRAFATLYLGGSQLTAGRQRIAWGTGYVWNPTDLLNPTNPIAIERDEKDGVDALYLEVPLDALSRLEVALAPVDAFRKTSFALRSTVNLRGYDLSLMAGSFQQQRFALRFVVPELTLWQATPFYRRETVVGADFAGYLWGAGFRGEFAYTWQPQSAPKHSYARLVLNLDYNFPGDVYGMAEFYVNGQGTTDKSQYDLLALLRGDMLNLARHYFALVAGKSLSPLWRADFYGIANLDDGSALAGPAITYSLATNFDVHASAYLFLGGADTEFGRAGNSFFASLQYFF